MSEEKKEATPPIPHIGRIDSLFQRVVGYVGKQISTFVAFLFFLFTAGVAFGVFISMRFPELVPYFVIAPAIMGLIAYYNRTVATILFVALILVFFI